VFFENTDQQNYNSQTGSTDSGGMTTFSDTDDYKSFWDITQHWEMFYHYKNKTGDSGNPAMLDFRITPYVGLAYYDGWNNGDYNDQGTSIVNFNIQPPGTYPNMFDPTGNEIGNFMPARPFTLTGAGIPSYWGTVELEVFSPDHCHVIGANLFTGGTNPMGIFFDISAPPATYQPSTPQEEGLLSQYGKVFFYYWEAVDPATAVVIAHGYVMPKCDTSVPAHWTNTTVTANLPTGGVADLYYNLSSFEVVLDFGTFPDVGTFTNTVGGKTYNYTVELKTFLGGTSNPVSTLELTYN